MKRQLWLIALLLPALCAVAACRTASPAAQTAAPPVSADEAWWTAQAAPEEEAALREKAKGMVEHLRARRGEYLLGAEDLIRITVWNKPDLSKETRIRPDGSVFVPHVGNIAAEGVTVAALQQTLTEKLQRVIRDPQVDVEIVEYASKVYYVFGQVIKPGMYPIKASTTLLEAVATASGPTEKANLASACLIREGLVVPIDFYGLFERGDVSQNLLLADGDVIYLPNVDDAKVYVLGEVNAAAAVPMRSRRLTLSEAIAQAGGFNEITAYKRGIKIIRGTLANPKVYTVNYDEILRGKKPDVAFLQNGDIVYVPAGGLTKWDRVLGQLLPNLSRIVLDAASIDSLTRNR